MRVIEGYLKSPNGTPLQRHTLRLLSLQSSLDGVPPSYAADLLTDQTGRYSGSIIDGRYNVQIIRPDNYMVAIGSVTITSGPAEDIFTLIGAPAVEANAVQLLLDTKLDINSSIDGGSW